MKNLHLIIASVLLSSVIQAQTPVRLSWTAELNGNYCLLDSVVVKNQKGEKYVFYYPDTTLICCNDEEEVGIIPVKPEAKTSLKVYPNPFSDNVQVDFSLAQSGKAELSVYDMLGREVIRYGSILENGTHSFLISLPKGIYTLQLQTEAGMQTARLLSEKGGNTPPQILHTGKVPYTEPISKKMQKTNDLFFTYGDTLTLQAFISDSTAIPSLKEHTIIPTKDTHIVFLFYDACNCIMDTLKGEWTWVKTAGGWGFHVNDNLFTMVIKILSQNEDNSINYEVFTEDTLYFQGSCKIEQVRLYGYTGPGIDIKFPFYERHLIYYDIPVWGLFFYDIYLRVGGTVLTFWDGCPDGTFVYFKKIK